MKKILTIFLTFLCSVCLSQTINKKGHEFRLEGFIEIDGHLVKNDTCKIPFKYIQSLGGCKIIRNDVEYFYRECKIKNCQIIHLYENNLNGTLITSNLFLNPKP